MDTKTQAKKPGVGVRILIILAAVLVVSGVLRAVLGIVMPTALTAKAVTANLDIPQADAQALADAFNACDGKATSVAGYGTHDDDVIVMYRNPMAEPYYIMFTVKDGRCTKAWLQGYPDTPFISDGEVQLSFTTQLVRSDAEMHGATYTVQRMAKNSLKVPDSAKFDDATTRISKSWDGSRMVYRVSGSYSAKNAYGVRLQGSYDGTCTSTDADNFTEGVISMS